MTLSSAYIQAAVPSLRHSGRSFMKIRNSNRQRMEPCCGNQDVKYADFDVLPPMATFCVLALRKSVIHSRMDPPMP